MAKCKKLNKTKKILCIGSLTKTIQIETRAITPDDSSTDFTETFTAVKTVKAMVETLSGVDIFNGTQIVGTATHRFTIKFITGVTITSQNWIILNDEYYDILRVDNVDENNRYLVLLCTKRGDDTLKANWS